MEADLKSYLEGMESRLSSQIAESEQRSRAHTEIVETRLSDLEGMESRLSSQIAESEQRSRAHTEIVETRLLTEFWKWARTADARYRQHQAIVGGLDIRVQTIEDRLSDIEQRLAS